MLQITTNELKNRKKVEIDGQTYIVRRLGAGDQLTVSQYMRELKRLAKKEEAGGSLSEQEDKRLAEIEASYLQILANCFDDLSDGEKSKTLVRSLTPDELAEVMDQIFNGTPEPSVS